MNYQKIITLYDTAEHAEAVRRNLEAAGFSRSDIGMESSKSLTQRGEALREPGIWNRLFGRNLDQNEITIYGNTLDSGGAIVTVRVPESEVARAKNILNAQHVVDVQSRAANLVSGTANLAHDEVLRLAEEQLNVGKRVVQDGMTRIRRFVTEKPVEAQVTLHDEHAQVVRRAIADPMAVKDFEKDIDWADKTIEVVETIEEAVVTKSAYVAEEVIIRKEGKDHVETIHDKVRRQQVEVERIPATGGSPIKKDVERISVAPMAQKKTAGA